jgi:hypothetical protein
VRLFACCCEWSYVIGKRRVYGPIYRCGIGDFPEMLASSQRMMTREQFEDEYADCAACADGSHKHGGAMSKKVPADDGGRKQASGGRAGKAPGAAPKRAGAAPTRGRGTFGSEGGNAGRKPQDKGPGDPK